ncbi:MAG: hypothetical protein M0T78_03140 [Actinomycetota bacterium]|nr:hypothetical protein [Actinomycetota bacterium]
MAWLVRSEHVISSLRHSSRRVLIASSKNGSIRDDESTLLVRASIAVAWRLDFGVFVVRLSKDGSITSIRHHRRRLLPLVVVAIGETFIVPQKIAEHARLALGDIFEVIE